MHSFNNLFTVLTIKNGIPKRHATHHDPMLARGPPRVPLNIVLCIYDYS